jgi:hypothetical protein
MGGPAVNRNAVAAVTDRRYKAQPPADQTRTGQRPDIAHHTRAK